MELWFQGSGHKWDRLHWVQVTPQAANKIPENPDVLSSEIPGTSYGERWKSPTVISPQDVDRPSLWLMDLGG